MSSCARRTAILAELIEEIGEPPPVVVAEAEAWADHIVRHLKKAPMPGAK